MAYTVGIDVGGTFTDLLLFHSQTNDVITHKTPSTPENPAIAVLAGLTQLAERVGTSEREFFRDIDLIVHGTTVATNAVLTETGAKCGLLTTEGFRDILEMRRGIRDRNHLYDNKYVAPPSLVPRHLRQAVRERVDVEGEVIQPIDREDLIRAIQALKEEEVAAVAICFLHSYRSEAHEREAAELVRELLPEAFLSVSTDVLPQIRLYPRVSTTVMNAYLGPVVERYMAELVDRLAAAEFGGTLMIMQSNGGIAHPQSVARLPASIALSGPAAGPVAGLAYMAARDLQDCTVIDMGGTSFDASLVKDGAIQVTRAGEINRHSISLPTTHVHTIGAGGGSIGWLDEGGLLRVGPRSAGADPGPAAYGRGGTEPTVTDADVVLGYIDPDCFLGGHMPLSRQLAEQAIDEHLAKPLGISVEAAAAGMYQMVNLAMADGTKNISVAQGYDPREFPLVVAGGAGAVHSGMIAHELDIPYQFIPRYGPVICAAGMLMADLRHDFARAFNAVLSDIDRVSAQSLIAEMAEEGRRLLLTEGAPEETHDVVVSADLRYTGQHHELILSFDPGDLAPSDGNGLEQIEAAFQRRHEEVYGFSYPGSAIEMLSLRTTAIARRNGIPLTSGGGDGTAADARKGERPVYLTSEGTKKNVPIYDGAKLPPGAPVTGPAVIEEAQTTIVVPEFFDLQLDSLGSYVMFRKGLPPVPPSAHDLQETAGSTR